VLLAVPIVTLVLRVPVPADRLAATGFAVLGYNAGLWLLVRWIRRVRPGDVSMFESFVRLQIALDWITMAELLTLSGGAESPAIVFFLFHIAVASLLLPHRLSWVYVGMAPLIVAAVAALEYFGVVPHVAVIQPPRFRDPRYLGVAIGFFAVACYTLAYCCMTIAHRLRRRETELAGLYVGVRTIASTLEIADVLDRIVEAATRVLGCRAAAIRLLDPTRSQVEFAASCGLSETYRSEVPEEWARSQLDRDTLRDGVVHVDDVKRDPRVWHAERVRAEGIASMLSVPIAGRAGALGVLRAYGGPGHRFSTDDEAYLRAVAAQGAVAVEHAKAFRRLAELDRDKSRFLRMTTHELRSPVRVTESLLMTLAQGYAGDLTGEQRELVDRAQRRLQSLHVLVDDLLSLAAGKADLVVLRQRAVDLREVVREVGERFRVVAGARGVALDWGTGHEPIEVWCDPDDLERIVVNLVSNAVKYTPRGRVSVAAAAEGDRARLDVTDTGIGIPEDALPHLFDEFYRASNARAVEESGTGLGLAIVKLLVDRYGGELSVTSREGKGTTIGVSLARAPGRST
jgi:signal transduction histidine kinase